MADPKTLLAIYQTLHQTYGPQHWWPGDTPFEIMVGAILTQNTAWTNVEKAINNLKAHHALDPRKILEAPDDKLAQWIRPSGYFNVKAKRLKNFCRWYIEQGEYEALKDWTDHDLRHGLLSVNGVGPETADDMMLYAFDRPVFVIDAYTRRIFSRLGLVAGDEGYEHLRHWFEAHLGADVELFGEFHALIVSHGKDVCRVKPVCGECCLQGRCGYL